MPDPSEPPVNPLHRPITSIVGHFVPLLASAVMLLLAFPHPGWGWLAYVALAPMTVLALRSASARRLLWTSYVVSFAWWLLAIRWMTPVTGGGFAALAAYMAVYTPATLLIVRGLDRGFASRDRTRPRGRVPATIALPMAWVSMELIRGWFLQGGFGWFALAHSQAPYLPEHDVSWIIQCADLFGQWTVSFVVAMSSGLIADLLTRPLIVPVTGDAETGPVRRFNRTLLGMSALWLAVLSGAFAYGGLRVMEYDRIRPISPTVRIAVVQTNVAQSNKQSPTDEQEQQWWNALRQLVRDASTVMPDVIVWPETMSPIAVNEEAVSRALRAKEVRDQIVELVDETGADLLAGAHAYTEWEQVKGREPGIVYVRPTKRYNSVYLFRPGRTSAVDRYSKIHRVPFGEYVPWVGAWPWLKEQFIKYLTPYDTDYTLQPGAHMTVFEVQASPPKPIDPPPPLGPGHIGGLEPAGDVERVTARIVTPICFEDAVSRLIRRMIYEDGEKRADVIVNVTNDGWFAGTGQPLQHFQLAVLRSMENRVPTARSVNVGPSGFIDSVGRIIEVVEKDGRIVDVEGVAAAELTLDPRTTLYGRVGQWPVLVLTAATIVLGLAGWWRRRGT